MRLKKVIKKIAALSVGATMVGATVLGAMAADLGDYPSPLFIKDGKFSGILVVGDKADAKDIIGITDVMGSLQYAATKSVSGGETVTATVSSGVKIDKSSSHLNYGESFSSIFTTGIDVDDLPSVLADGAFDESEGNNKNDIEYEQELNFEAGTAMLVFAQDDDDAPNAGDYLYISKSIPAYNYVLDMDDDLEYDNTSESAAGDDLETATFMIQGNTYTITDVKLTNGKIDKLYLQAGETSIWLEEGVTLMRTIGDVEHEIVLVDVEDVQDGDCGISVDGVTQWTGVGSSKTINGVEVGVTKSLTIHSATQDTDTCQVNLGATELMLENDDEIELGGEDIDGSLVVFTEADGGYLEAIEINYTPEDEIYLASGGNWIDPVFGNFEYNYAGLTKSTEYIEISASSDDAELEVTSNDGKDITIPFHYNGSALLLANGPDIDEAFIVSNSASLVTGGDITNVEGVQILKVLSNGEPHIIEIKDIDTSEDKITVKDVTYGGEKTSDYDATGVASTIELPEGTITMAINETSNTIALSTDVNDCQTAGSCTLLFESENEAEIGVAAGLSAYNIMISENPDGSNDDGDTATQTTINVNLTYDASDEEIDILRPQADGNLSTFQDVSDTNNDDIMADTNFGTRLKYDDENKKTLEIWYPLDEVYGNGFVSKAGADITTTAVSSGAVVVQRISVGATKLASEVTNVKSQNAILVGGPCANSAAAEALGNPADCAAGFEEGKGMIQLVEFSTGKVAMIVAGYSADDTRNAATAIANYKDYALSGMKVEVSKVGASLTVTETSE